MATPASAADAAPKGGGKKKLIIIVAAALVLVLGGGAALLVLKKKPAEEGDDDAPAAVESSAKKKGGELKAPTFVPLDTFTVNLADKEVDRFAQIGIILQVDDEKTSETIKNFLPAIRNNILMVLSHKTSGDLLTREGKEQLAKEILRESSRAMGIELDDEDDSGASTDDQPKKKKKKKAAVESPITHVLFSNFIVQ
ncbi:MAG: flagellar basal body-associated FliL family protein [Burkholderiaceae bacterium]|nr:flagellar basal body-associated FliL family protein [Burkholderiaceae bacterium]